ncbi:TadE/TadG family type IV pilus assembly protein [Ferrimonas aestuarii]|nr:TadE/TadG family type IV pilus assembly protein [Ferrimonas aestuarii]
MKRSHLHQRGVAAIEATITLPILFLLFFAIGELGRAMYQYNQLNSVVRNTCRYLINNAKPGTTSLIDITAEVQATAKNLGVYGDTGNLTPVLPGLSVSNITISVPSSGDLISVSATYNWNSIFSGDLGGNYGQTLNYGFPLTATVSMRAL